MLARRRNMKILGLILAVLIFFVSVRPESVCAKRDSYQEFALELSVKQSGNKELIVTASGEAAGDLTSGKPIESFKLSASFSGKKQKGALSYTVSFGTEGWSAWQSGGKTLTSLRPGNYAEAIKIKLTQMYEEIYDIYYRVYLPGCGWMDWAKNGDAAGTNGLDAPFSGVQVMLVKKEAAYKPISGTCPYVSYAFVNNIFYEGELKNGKSTGRASNAASLGNPSADQILTGYSVNLTHGGAYLSGALTYKGYSEKNGWNSKTEEGKLCTSGEKGEALDAVSISLSGDLSKYFDVYYRSYIQTFGWLGWAKNGASSGSTGAGKHIKSLQICLVLKGKQPAEYKEGSAFLTVKKKAELDVKYICQNPELPAGCESVSLTMVLNYYGYKLKKTEIADKWLIYGENFMTGFFGTPYDNPSGCIYSPGLSNSANQFLKAKNDKRRSYNLLGTSFDELPVYVSNGYPVIVWGTIDYELAEFYDHEAEYNNKTYKMASNLHCLVLSGYDLERNKVTLIDPLVGKKTIDMDEFKKIYNSIYKQAVVIY